MEKKYYVIEDENGPMIVDEDLHLLLTNPEANKILVEEIQKEINQEVIREICKNAINPKVQT